MGFGIYIFRYLVYNVKIMTSSAMSPDFLPDHSKITNQTVLDLATEYGDSGLPEYVADILRLLPHKLKEPIGYTFRQHVTKERPLSILHVGDELGINRERSLGAAACVDVLWNVAIVVDDIYDGDETNARQEPSAWSKFGKTTALAASTAAVASTVGYTASRYGVNDARQLSSQLREGIASLTQSRNIGYDSPIEDYFSNYDMRSRFYAAGPISTIAKKEDIPPQRIVGAQNALAHMNRAGQMINDLQDFDISDDRSRTQSFSDLRNGVKSIPIRHLWLAASPEERRQLKELEGKPSLTGNDEGFIHRLMVKTDFVSAMKSLIDNEYRKGREDYISALEPSPQTAEWLDSWIAYKQGQSTSVEKALAERALTYL